jgi:hypothetical protein
VCTVKKISPSEIRFFIYVIIAMSSVFNLFRVVTAVCNEGNDDICFYCKVKYPSRMFNFMSSIECVIFLVISF